MNIREYIESGVIELYVMNALTAQEAAEVESMARLHPEIQAEINEVEKAMESYSQIHAIEPSANLKDEIINKIKEGEKADIEKPTQTPKSIEQTGVTSPLSISRYLAWGIAGLFAISTLYFYNNYRTLKAEKEKCEQEQQTQLLKNQNAIAVYEQKINFINKNETKKVDLISLDKTKSFKAVVYWNPKDKTTLLAIQDLPKPSAGKQYQLWAIVKDVKNPIDAGVFEYKVGELQTMKSFDKVDTFAVTLEPEGGSKTPTLEQMTVIGSL